MRGGGPLGGGRGRDKAGASLRLLSYPWFSGAVAGAAGTEVRGQSRERPLPDAVRKPSHAALTLSFPLSVGSWSRKAHSRPRRQQEGPGEASLSPTAPVLTVKGRGPSEGPRTAGRAARTRRGLSAPSQGSPRPPPRSCLCLPGPKWTEDQRLAHSHSDTAQGPGQASSGHLPSIGLQGWAVSRGPQAQVQSGFRAWTPNAEWDGRGRAPPCLARRREDHPYQDRPPRGCWGLRVLAPECRRPSPPSPDLRGPCPLVLSALALGLWSKRQRRGRGWGGGLLATPRPREWRNAAVESSVPLSVCPEGGSGRSAVPGSQRCSLVPVLFLLQA